MWAKIVQFLGPMLMGFIWDKVALGCTLIYNYFVTKNKAEEVLEEGEKHSDKIKEIPREGGLTDEKLKEFERSGRNLINNTPDL
jgi:hypothetical protein